MKAWAPTQVVTAIAGMLCAMLLAGVAAGQSGGANVETNPAPAADTAVTSVEAAPAAAQPGAGAPAAEAAKTAPVAVPEATPVTEKPKFTNPDEDRRIGSEPGSSPDGPAGGKGTSGGLSIWDILWPLLIVLGGIVVLFWAARRFLPGMRRMAGSRAVEVLGRTYLSPRQSVTVVRLGRRILVIGQTAEQLSALASISDPEEVSELVGLCEGSGQNSATATFGKIFRGLDRQYEESAVGDQEVAEGSGGDEVSVEDIDRVRNELRSLTDKVRQVSNGRKKEP